MLSEATLLNCPIRGSLKVKQRAADSLTFTEEKQRIDAIRYLLHRKYPRDNFGVETTLFKFGHKGRNSFRTDFAVYDTAFEDIKGRPLDKRLDHICLLAEIKRDNTDAARAKATQVTSALRLVPSVDTLGVYWDDVEQRFFFKTLDGTRQRINNAPISKIPVWGDSVGSVRLTYPDLDAATNLVRVFDELENALHVYVVDKAERYSLIQQLLITKIHDENMHQFKTEVPLAVQDFSAEAVVDSVVVSRMNEALAKAATHYEQYLPKRIGKRFKCNAEALRNATKILAPLNILGSRTQVIQAFYMKFAKSLYKWDLAQYFTPHEVIDFIVDVVHPQYGEHVKDPACGSADFLISSFRHAGNSAQSKNCVWGADNSAQAVQISILNMVLNGDGKTQIVQDDSLESYGPNSKRFQAVLCNPPFGTKIVEKRVSTVSRTGIARAGSCGARPDERLAARPATGVAQRLSSWLTASPTRGVSPSRSGGRPGRSRGRYGGPRPWPSSSPCRPNTRPGATSCPSPWPTPGPSSSSRASATSTSTPSTSSWGSDETERLGARRPRRGDHGGESVFMADRLADTRRFYDLLARLEARIGGKRKLADCNGSMNWPNSGICFFCEDGEVRSSSGKGLRIVWV